MTLLIVTGSASADVNRAGGIKYASKTVTTDPARSYKLISLKCPRRTHVLDGGQVSNAMYGELAQGYTKPIDRGDGNSTADDGWEMRVDQEPNVTRTIDATAICAHTKMTYVVKSITVTPMTQLSGFAKCPKGTHVYGGGWNFPGFNTNSSFPVDGNDSDDVRDDKWWVYLDNPGNFTGFAGVYALCGERFPRYKEKKTQAAPMQNTGLHVHCPKGKFLYGGGEENDGGLDEAHVSDMGPFGNPAPSEGFHVSVDNLTNTPFELEGFAICGKRFD